MNIIGINVLRIEIVLTIPLIATFVLKLKTFYIGVLFNAEYTLWYGAVHILEIK